MKKYIKPEISVTVVMGSTLLAGSGGPFSGNNQPPGVGNSSSRYRNSLWEDDEDDWLEE